MSNMIGYRRAAVALHELNEGDRHWVLAELPDEDRVTLVRYLDELKTLGFSTEGVSHNGSASSSPIASSSTNPFDRVRDASALEMYSILENEPSALIAQFMAIQNWRWGPAFLQLFSPMRKERIRAAMSHGVDVAPARKSFLIEAIGSRLKESRAADVPSTSAIRSWMLVSPAAMRQAFAPFMRLVRSWKR